MEYLKGPSLASYLQTLHRSGQKLSFEQIGQLLKSIILGIDYAHSQGIVHRDIKPANIILHSRNREFEEDTPLTKSVEAIITDFGLARIAHSGQQTASGFVSGTPAYMSPEQARGSKVDHRTDIYSLGIILYELLAGRVPFEADTAITVIFKHINDAPPPIEDIYPELQAVIDKALTKFPEDRYNSGNELLVDFYNAVGMRLEAETIHSLRSHTPRSTAMVIKKKKPALSPLWIGTGIFVCGCISFLLLSGARHSPHQLRRAAPGCQHVWGRPDLGARAITGPGIHPRSQRGVGCRVWRVVGRDAAGDDEQVALARAEAHDLCAEAGKIEARARRGHEFDAAACGGERRSPRTRPIRRPSSRRSW